MENYGPGQEIVVVEESQISKSGSAEEAMELEVTDDTDVRDSIESITATLQDKPVLLRSTTHLGVHAHIVGELRSKKKGYWIYSELLGCEIKTQWTPLSNALAISQANKGRKKKNNGEESIDLDVLMVSRQSHQLLTLLSLRPIKLLKNLPTKQHIFFPKILKKSNKPKTSNKEKKS